MPTIILQRFANREYRLTLQDILKKEKSGGDKYAEKQAEKYAIAVRDTYVLTQNLEHGLIGASPEDGGRVRALDEWDIRRGIRSLDIIDEFQQIAASKRQRGGWGFQAKPTSFTRNARHRLLEAGAVVDQEFGKNCYEVTLTLPGSGDEAYRTIANWSGWMCNRLLREVNRNTITSHWFYVWEWQKRGALHLHFAIAGSNISEVKKVAQSLEYNWFELLLELEQKTDVELFRKDRNITWRNRPEKWQSHVSPINKSCAAYFSKYAGKSTNNQSKAGHKYFPARWWGSSRAIKQGIELRRARYEFEGSRGYCVHLFETLFEWLKQQNVIKSYSYNYDLGKSRKGTSLGGGEVHINYYQDEDFIRLQNWEPYVIEHCYSLGELDADIDSESYADIPDILRRHYKNVADRGKNPDPSPHPHSQPSNAVSSEVLQGVLRRQPTLAIRARLQEYLARVRGEASASEQNSQIPLADHLVNFIQLELLDNQ